MHLKYQFWKNVTSEKWNSVGLNTPKSEDKYVVKVFNPTEFHFSEVTSFKIGTLNNWFISFDSLISFNSFQVFNEQIEYELTVEVLPGLILQIDQTVGACGDNDVKTDLFKFIEIDASRNAVNRVWYERTLNNGTTISFNELPLQSRGGPTNIHPMYLELEDTNEEQLDQAVSEAKTLM